MGPVAPVAAVVGETVALDHGSVGAVAPEDVAGWDVGGVGGVLDGAGPDEVTGRGTPTPGRVGLGKGAVGGEEAVGGEGAVGFAGEVVNPETSSELATSPMSVVTSTSPPPAEWSSVPEVRPPQANVFAAPQTPTTTDQPNRKHERLLTGPLSLEWDSNSNPRIAPLPAELAWDFTAFTASRAAAGKSCVAAEMTSGPFRSMCSFCRNACASTVEQRKKFTLRRAGWVTKHDLGEWHGVCSSPPIPLHSTASAVCIN